MGWFGHLLTDGEGGWGGGGPPHNEKPCHPAKFDGHSCSGKADNKIMSRGTVFKSSRVFVGEVPQT